MEVAYQNKIMKKLLLALLVLFGFQTKAQINFCDSISYTTSTTLNYPLGLAGSISTLDTSAVVSWTWTVCNSSMCYSSNGQFAYFGQVSPTDTLKVCYDVIIDINGMTYACSKCDTLVYNQNSYQWEVSSAQPLGFAELELNTPDDEKTYDLLGRELLEIPKGTIYIKNRKKFIK
tara:strand:- start:10 stop:534 length:525 start_codon:yes stop_codon:yes gene_type:complete